VHEVRAQGRDADRPEPRRPWKFPAVSDAICRIGGAAAAAYLTAAMKALTMKQLMKLSPEECERRGRDWMRRKMKPAAEADAKTAPHPTLKRWIKPEPPIEIIG
jgi:hypothetical protein